MSYMPAPKTKRETTELYKALAAEYIGGDKSLCDICTPYTKKQALFLIAGPYGGI